MAPRLQLHDLLASITENVYFQPPSNIRLSYPCIIYRRSDARSIFADNAPYRNTQRYEVTVIDRNPDSELITKLIMLPLCTYNRYFAVDDLNHDVFNLFF